MATVENINRANGLNLNILKETISSVEQDGKLGKCKFRARNKWIGAGYNCTTVYGYYAAGQEMTHAQKFELHADEPPILSGDDQAANPVEHLLHALASCVTTSIIAHAAVRGIEIQELESELEGDIDMRGFLGLDPDVPKGYTNIRMKFKVKTAAENVKLLKTLAEFSPVYNTIIHGAMVNIEIEPL